MLYLAIDVLTENDTVIIFQLQKEIEQLPENTGRMNCQHQWATFGTDHKRTA